jgi:hypothetical protein
MPTRGGKGAFALVGKDKMGNIRGAFTPPGPSPIKGEGSGSQVPHMKDLPLSAIKGGGKVPCAQAGKKPTSASPLHGEGGEGGRKALDKAEPRVSGITEKRATRVR